MRHPEGQYQRGSQGQTGDEPGKASPSRLDGQSVGGSPARQRFEGDGAGLRGVAVGGAGGGAGVLGSVMAMTERW